MKTTTISSKRNGNVLETDYQKNVERNLGARRMEKVISAKTYTDFENKKLSGTATKTKNIYKNGELVKTKTKVLPQSRLAKLI